MRKIPIFLVGLIVACTMVGCSIQEFADKMLPDSVKESAIDTVDAVMRKDAEFLKPLKNEKMSEEDFAKVIDGVFAQVSDGDEFRRDIVGASFNSSISTSEGKTKTAKVIYEIRTADGFTLITLNYYQSRTDTKCCRLTGVNVQKHEASPVRATLTTMANIGKIVSIMVLLGILGLVFFYLIFSQTKESPARSILIYRRNFERIGRSRAPEWDAR